MLMHAGDNLWLLIPRAKRKFLISRNFLVSALRPMKPRQEGSHWMTGRMKEEILKLGATQTVVVDDKNYVLSGYDLVLKAKEAGQENLLVQQIFQLTPAEKRGWITAAKELGGCHGPE